MIKANLKKQLILTGGNKKYILPQNGNIAMIIKIAKLIYWFFSPEEKKSGQKCAQWLKKKKYTTSRQMLYTRKYNIERLIPFLSTSKYLQKEIMP